MNSTTIKKTGFWIGIVTLLLSGIIHVVQEKKNANTNNYNEWSDFLGV